MIKTAFNETNPIRETNPICPHSHPSHPEIRETNPISAHSRHPPGFPTPKLCETNPISYHRHPRIRKTNPIYHPASFAAPPFPRNEPNLNKSNKPKSPQDLVGKEVRAILARSNVKKPNPLKTDPDSLLGGHRITKIPAPNGGSIELLIVVDYCFCYVVYCCSG